MPTRAQIVSTARSYIGTPFQHQGRIKGLSCDCIGLPICTARDLGISLPISAVRLNYDPFPADDTVLRELKAHLIEVAIEDMKPGDVLCLRVPVPCHAAIVSDLAPGLGMIHAYDPNKQVVEHTIDEHWRRKIAGVFLFPGVSD